MPSGKWNESMVMLYREHPQISIGVIAWTLAVSYFELKSQKGFDEGELKSVIENASKSKENKVVKLLKQMFEDSTRS